MNSRMSTLLSTCSPPLMMFIIGTGMEAFARVPFSSAMCSYSGWPLEVAAALALARDTARIAFAPKLDLFSVPSKVDRDFITDASLILASLPRRAWSDPGGLTAPTAFSTPLPMKRDLSPSRSSSASREPVEAPDGSCCHTNETTFRVLRLQQSGYFTGVDDFTTDDFNDFGH